MEARVVAALSIIAVCGVAGIIALAVYLPRRRREKLRRRGIKDHRTEQSNGRHIA